jgi:hypothetical protein
VDICILPPIDGAQSDCERIDEDDLASVKPADVYGGVHVFVSINGIGPDSEDNRAEQKHHNVIHQKATRERSRAEQLKTSNKIKLILY